MLSLLKQAKIFLLFLAICSNTQLFNEMQKVDGCDKDREYTLERDISIVRALIQSGSDYYGPKKDGNTNAYYSWFADRSNPNPNIAGFSKYLKDFYGYYWPSGSSSRRREVSNVVLDGVCDNKHPVCSTGRAAAVDITEDGTTRTVKISVCDKYFDNKQYYEEDCHTKYVSDLAKYKATEIIHALMVAPGPFGGLTQVAWGEKDSHNLALGTFSSTAKDKDGKLICSTGKCDPKLAANNADTRAILTAIGYGKLNCAIGKLYVKTQCDTVQASKKDECDKNCLGGCQPVRKAIEKRKVIYDETPTKLVWMCIC